MVGLKPASLRSWFGWGWAHKFWFVPKTMPVKDPPSPFRVSVAPYGAEEFSLSKESVGLIMAAMEYVDPPEDFHRTQYPASAKHKNITVFDGSSSYSTSMVRLRRPMSVSLAERFCDLMTAVCNLPGFDAAAEFASPNSLTDLLEIRTMYEIAKAPIHAKLESRIRDLQASPKGNKSVKMETRAFIGPLMAGTDVGDYTELEALYPFGGGNTISGLDARARAVFGVGLAPLVAPVLFLTANPGEDPEALRRALMYARRSKTAREAAAVTPPGPVSPPVRANVVAPAPAVARGGTFADCLALALGGAPPAKKPRVQPVKGFDFKVGESSEEEEVSVRMGRPPFRPSHQPPLRYDRDFNLVNERGEIVQDAAEVEE